LGYLFDEKVLVVLCLGTPSWVLRELSVGISFFV